MTSREALDYIKNYGVWSFAAVHGWTKPDEKLVESFSTVEKYIEVLEILKNKNIDLLALKKFNESEAYNLYVYTYNEKAKNKKNELIKDIDCLDNTEFVKIKEWLDDDK